jgi:hypothetical protein
MVYDDYILFPGLHDHAEQWRRPSSGTKSQSFYSVLASAILSDNLFTFCLDFVTDIPCPFL